MRKQLLENSRILWIWLHREAGRKLRPLPTEETLLKLEFERFVDDLERGRVRPDTIFQWDEALEQIRIPKKSRDLQPGGKRNQDAILIPPPIRLPSPAGTVSKKVVKPGGVPAGNPASEESDFEDRRCASPSRSPSPARKRGGGEDSTTRQEGQLSELPKWVHERGRSGYREGCR